MKQTLRSLAALSLCLAVSVHGQPPNPPLDVTPDQSVGVLSEDPASGERWSTSVFPFGNYVGPVSGEDVFCRTYLRFPLAGIPADATVQSATLYVYVDDYWPEPGGAPMSVYPVAAEWTVEGVDWYDMAAWPALGEPVATTEVTSDGGWFAWDVTGLVQGWLSGQPNYGLAVAAADLGSAASNWAAARRLAANEPATLPHLFVSYTTPTPTATPRPPTPVPTETPPPAPPAPTSTPAPPPPTPTPVPILLPATGTDAGPTLSWPLLVGVGLGLLASLAAALRANRAPN